MASQTTSHDLAGEPSTDGSLHGVPSSTDDKKVALTSAQAIETALGTIYEEFTIDSDNSPYAEVRANVPNIDDVELPVNTVRMWFLGIVFTMVITLPPLGFDWRLIAPKYMGHMGDTMN